MIRVGDPSIDWLAFPPQSDRKRAFTYESGVHRRVGTVLENIVSLEINGKPALHRTQTFESSEYGNRRAEVIVFQDGFLPYSYSESAKDYQISISYQGSRIVGQKDLRKGKTVPIELQIEEPVFDAHCVEMVLRLLPFKEGYSAEIPIFHARKAKKMLVAVREIGTDMVSDSSKKIDAWNVRTDWEGIIQNYWIALKTRELLKQVSNLSGNVQLKFVR